MSDQPKTLEALVQELFDKMHPEDREQIKRELKTNSAKMIAVRLHHGYGTWIRNTYGLWNDSSKDLRRDIWTSLTEDEQEFYFDWWDKHGDFCVGEDMHADDASGIIVNRLIERVAKS